MSDDVTKRLDELYQEPSAEVRAEDAKQDPESGVYMFDDAAALKIVLDDAAAADNFMNINSWAAGWVIADTIYQSPASVSAFDGGNIAQANVPKFLVSNHLNTVVPKLLQGVFYEDPPFLLRPRPGTTQEVTRAKTALFSYQLKEMEFEDECEKAFDQMGLLGTCIMKWGYTEYKEQMPTYRRLEPELTQDSIAGSSSINSPDSDDFELYYTERLISHPWIKYCDIRTVLVDPSCRVGDIRKAKWVIYRDFVTFAELERLRGVEGYNIPDEDILKQIFFQKESPTPGVDNIVMTIVEGLRGYIQQAIPRHFRSSADPTQTVLEILEHWDDQKVIVVLCCNGHNILIRNEENPYHTKPFFSANWRNVQNSFYGQGLAQLIGSEQLVQQGVTNLALDLLAYGLQPTALRKKGFNAPTQMTRWKQGGIIDVDDDVDKAFKFLTMPPIPGEAWTAIQQALSDAASTSGANEQVMQGVSSPGIKTTGMRTATGASAVIQANASRLDGPDGRFIRQIFLPWLYQMDKLNNQLLPTSVLRDVLGEELGQTWKGDHIKFRNAKLEFEVLAGAHLGPKREMAQLLPIIVQLMNNPTFVQNMNMMGYKFDGVAIFKAMSDLGGWKYSQDFVIPMTPEEKRMILENSPAMMQQRNMQGQAAMQTQKFQQEQQQEDQRQLGKAANEVMRQAIEQSTTHEEVTGEPGGEGFGSEVGL